MSTSPEISLYSFYTLSRQTSTPQFKRISMTIFQNVRVEGQG